MGGTLTYTIRSRDDAYGIIENDFFFYYDVFQRILVTLLKGFFKILSEF